MSMLAEPRRKGKYSVDPRGLNWSKDEDKFGQKLMEKMGWQKGKGLGANEDGKVDHVAVKLKSDNRGVGCTKSQGDNWIAHQDDFNSLLATLNADHSNQDSGEESGKGKVTKDSDKDKVTKLEETSKNSKGKIHYHKFAKGKDLSACNESDFDAIFGRRKSMKTSSVPTTASEINSGDNSENEKEESSAIVKEDGSTGNVTTEEHTYGLTTITNSVSVADYFAQKMAALKARRAGIGLPESRVTPNITSTNKQTTVESGEERSDNSSEKSQEDSQEEKVKKKKSKKSKRDKKEDSVIVAEEPAVTEETSKSRKSKKRKLNVADQDDETAADSLDICIPCDQSTEEREPQKKKKKKTKSKENSKDVKDSETNEKITTDDSNDSQGLGINEKIKKKKNKRKGKKTNCDNGPENAAKGDQHSDHKLIYGVPAEQSVGPELGQELTTDNVKLGFKGANIGQLNGYIGMVVREKKTKKEKEKES